MEQPDQSRYWLDHLVSKIIAANPEGKIIVSSGISPSGPYHVGHAREILTADAVLRGLQEVDRESSHLHFVDNFDVLRKRYPYLDESYENEVGKPLCNIPAPDGKSESYAQQFFDDYLRGAEMLGIEMSVMKANQLYEDGVYTDLIERSLSERNEIAKILKKVSGREVSEDWQPIQILDESTGRLNTAKFLEYDMQSHKAHYLGNDDNKYTADATKGEIKLDWRVDWPARWKIYGVQVEGFGREHATKGGSYDTGKVIVKEIFDGEAPIPVPYEIISLKGETKKMSSSLGNLVTLRGALEIIPSEILRYFTFKSRPEKQLNFDPEMGLYVLMDEYAKTEAQTLSGEDPEFKRAWQIANLAGEEHVISTVPFSHMVMVYQTANADLEIIHELLERTGHSEAVRNQKEAISKELGFIKKWLDNYAPEKVKFNILNSSPELAFSESEQKFISSLESELNKSSMKPEEIHSGIYESATENGIKPADAFTLLYRLFIGKDYGPKLGFFLSCLDKKFVLQRLSLKN